MFQLSNIEIVRGGRQILGIEQLNIPTNELTVVLGHNGSGKSTLVNLLSGQMPPDKGTVTLNDTSLSSLKTKELAKTDRLFATKAALFGWFNGRRASALRSLSVAWGTWSLES